MSLRENQISEIADWVVAHVSREDFDKVTEKLPGEMQKAYIKRNTLKQQPTSVWRHFKNWWKYRVDDWNVMHLGLFIIWAMLVSAFLGANYSAFSADAMEALNIPRAILILSIITLATIVIPWTVTLLCWRRWYVMHPINLHEYWRVEDYLE